MFQRLRHMLERVSGIGGDPRSHSRVLDTMPNLIGVAIDERVVYANRASQRWFGVSSESELLGRSIYEFVHPDEVEDGRAAVELARTSPEPVPSFEARMVGAGGAVLRVEVWLRRIVYRGREALLIHGREISERRPASRLDESEQRYRRLAENSSDVITEYSASGRLLYVSPSIERVLGYSAETWTNDVERSVEHLTHPDDLPRAEALFATGELPEKIEILQRIRHADGEYRWMHSTGHRFEAADGQRRVVLVSRDVSEQQRALEALRASEERYQSLARAVPVGIFRIDNRGRHVYLNERWSELTGIPHDAAMANPRSHPLHPDDAKQILELSRKALAEGRMLRLEQRIVRPDGDIRWVLNQAVPEFDNAGAFAGWVGTLTDLSDKKASEQGLAESEERLRLALEGAEMCTWEWDSERGRVRWSPNVARVLDIPAGEPVPETVREVLALVHPDDVEGGRAFARQRAERLEPFEVEFRLAPKPGRDGRWMLMRGHRVPESTRAVGVMADVTPRRRLSEERAELEARLRESQRLESLGLLAGGVAHDFNNLLVGILGNAELALARASGDASLRECLEEVQHAGQRAAGLVRQILAFAGRERIASERIDLRSVVDETLELLRHSVPARAKIDWLSPAAPAEVDGDPVQLRQVLMNLVTNACEALPREGGHVTVRVTSRPTGEVALEIADTGCGVDSASLAQIFDPFFTTKGAGRGLGLAVAHGVVRAHGGSLHVDSAPGRGTRMSVVLPAAPAEASASVPRSDSAEAEPARGEGTVLVVDDERGVREVARRALEAAGYSVLLAADRGQAIEQLRAHGGEIAAIVLDLTLGSESGEQLLAELRALAGGAPVLATSGYAAEPALRRLEEQGAAGFVQKPFTASGLARSVAGVTRARVS